MNSVEPSVPRRVLAWAREHGTIHNDCLLASNPCQDCRELIMRGFEVVYSNDKLTEAEVIAAIVKDFSADIIAEESEKAARAVNQPLPRGIQKASATLRMGQPELLDRGVDAYSYAIDHLTRQLSSYIADVADFEDAPDPSQDARVFTATAYVVSDRDALLKSLRDAYQQGFSDALSRGVEKA